MRQIAVVAVLLCNLVLSGCALNSEVRTVADDNSALIFGFFDMSEAPYTLGCVRITQGERAGIAYRQSCMTTLAGGGAGVVSEGRCLTITGGASDETESRGGVAAVQSGVERVRA